jgi:phosphoribosyl-AMP cyclohydrolase
MSATPSFPPQGPTSDVEHGAVFLPKFDADGLIPAIVTDALSGAVLMFAWMNAAALALTIEHRVGHFWSRSRAKLWRKGDDSGNNFSVVELRVDCDQDVVWLRVTVAGSGAACHTGAASCFYRTVALGSAALPSPCLEPVPAPTSTVVARP